MHIQEDQFLLFLVMICISLNTDKIPAKNLFIKYFIRPGQSVE